MNSTKTISDCMKRQVFSISKSASIGAAAEILVKQRVGTLPVVDEQGHLIGLVQMLDLLELVMPDFLRLVEDFTYVTDFGAVETRMPSPEVLAQPVINVMQPPVFVNEACGLLRAFSVLYQKQLHDLPVVDSEGRLIGITSRVDIGTVLLDSW